MYSPSRPLYLLLYIVPYLLLFDGLTKKVLIALFATFLLYIVSFILKQEERVRPIIFLHVAGVIALSYFSTTMFFVPLLILPFLVSKADENVDYKFIRMLSAFIAVGALLVTALSFDGSLFTKSNVPLFSSLVVSIVYYIFSEKTIGETTRMEELQEKCKDAEKQITELKKRLVAAEHSSTDNNCMSIILGLDFQGFDENENVQMVIETIQNATGAVCCAYYESKSDKRKYRMVHHSGRSSILSQEIPFDGNVVGETFETHQYTFMTDLLKKEKDSYRREQLNGVNAIVTIPVVVHDVVIGAFVAGLPQLSKKNEQNIVSLCTIIGNKVNMEFSKIREHRVVTEKSITDKLTGLYNRLYFDECLEKEFKQAQMEGKSIAYVLLDLDFFKQMNDTHGHDFGDEVLKTAAATMRDNIRSSDHAFRTGGDEFSLILNGVDRYAALHIATKIAREYEKKVEEKHLYAKKDGKDVKSSFSIGIAVYPHVKVETASELVKCADNAVYHVKEHGKNNIAVANQA